MKKIFILMIAFTMVAGLFAYEPNPKLFEVCYDKLDNCYMISYYEEVEHQYNFNGKRYITVLNTDNVEKEAIFHYEQLDAFRKACVMTLGLPNKNNVKYSEEQIAKVKEYKNRAINEVPFITEENFNSITEAQYVYKFTKYMKNIKKQNKNKW